MEHHRYPPPTFVVEQTTVTGSLDTTADRGSIADRRAATCGFNADRINTPRFRTTTTPFASSNFITIPSGISPTALLDSPILLPNSQPSPTTGTFPAPLLSYGNEALKGSRDPNDSVDTSSFRVKPPVHDSHPKLSNFDNQGYNVGPQALALADIAMDFEFPAEFSKEAAAKICSRDLVIDMKPVNSMVQPNFIDAQICDSDVTTNQTTIKRGPIKGKIEGMHHPMEEQKGTFTGTGSGRTSEDGYSWRKYGQKQVKGSEYPRSYYKCTNPSCQVKKKIERSHDGQITEIIYKGAHNHPKAQSVRRGQLDSSYDVAEIDDGSGNCVKIETGSVVIKTESGQKNNEPRSDWRADGMERTCSPSVVSDISDLISTANGKQVVTVESVETPELSSAVVSHEDDDDGTTQGSISIGGYTDEEESDSKRRKTESCMVEANMTSRAVREPRVVVQIESEVDILDDGYRWRKYGQKVVKGNPNPRSYYKCTSPGCTVRKHVERASHNLKYVITTYEGKHNHEVPVARNGNSSLSSNSCGLTPTPANLQPGSALARGVSGLKQETQMQGFMPGLDRRPSSVFSNEYLRSSSFTGNLISEMKVGGSSVYPMKFPAIQSSSSSSSSSMPYGSYGLNSNRTAVHLQGSMTSLIPQFPRSLGGMQMLNNGGSTGMGIGMGQVEAFYQGGGGQQLMMIPKQERKDENVYDSSSVYQRIMGNFAS
ncbi:Probable WRKY transcription factor 2 [Linum perenne]